ncbi:MAG: phosphotriesterase [Chloroflexota bacterium]
MSYVNTALGPIHPDEMGVTATHEHILWGPPGWEYNPEWWFHYPKLFAKCLNDMNEYRELGGGTVVDCSGIGLGRDVEFCRLLSRHSGVHIVLATGFWAQGGVSSYFLGKDIDYLADLFVHELTVGIGNTGVKAGVIKVGHGHFSITEYEERLHRAAARAAKRTGCAIITHGAWLGLEELAIFKSEGLDLSQVIVSHCSDASAIDLERDKKMAQMGAWANYDTFAIIPAWAITHYAMADEEKADLVKQFIDAGYIDRLLLSADVNLFSLGWSRSSPYVGKSTTADLLRYAPMKLRRIGISEDLFWKKIMTENPKQVIPFRD